MNFELKKETLKINQVTSDETTQILVDGDIIVPDSKPDVLRVLQVDAQALVSDKAAADGKLFIKGVVNAKIFYIPISQDGEPSGIKCINSSLSYNTELENKSAIAGMKLTVLPDVDHVEYAVVNERKMNIKAIVSLKTRTVKLSELTVVTDIASDDTGDIEIQKTPIKAYSQITNDEVDFVIKETFEVPNGKPTVSEMLKVDVKLSNQDVKIINNKVVLRGDAVISTLYTGDTGADIEFMEYLVPYSEVMEVEEIDENAMCEITPYVKDVFYEMEQDSDGDFRILKVEALIGTFIDAGFVSTYDIISDCFAPGYDVSLNEKTFHLDEIVDTLKSQSTLKHIVSLPDSMPPVDGVYNVIAKPFIHDCQIENRTLTIEGVIDTQILYFTNDPEAPISNYRVEVPFIQQIDAPSLSQNNVPKSTAIVDSLSYNINLASEIELRFILSTSTKAVLKNQIKFIDECEFSLSEAPAKAASITIYFAEQGDSIWDIAKKYKVSLSDIIKTNNLASDANLKFGQQIIIPRYSSKTA